MKTLKSKLTRPLCLVLALLVMAGSMLAAALTGSPYEVLKDAAFNMLTAESGTLTLSAELLVNGEPYEELSTQYTQFSPDASYSRFDRNESYSGNGLNLNRNIGDDTWRASYYPWSSGGYESRFSDLGRNDMYVRLAELSLDLLTGDLKNNIGMTYADGLRTMSGTYTAQQVPELYNALLTVLLSEQTRTYGRQEDISSTDTMRRYRQTRFEGREMVVTVYEETGYWYYYDPMTGEEISADDPRASKEHGWFGGGTRTLISENRSPVTREDYANASYNSMDVLDIPVEKAIIDYASGTARVDSDGNLVDGTASFRFLLTNIFGDVNEVEINFDIAVENLNSTDPQCPVVDAHEVFTEEFFKDAFLEIEGIIEKYYGTYGIFDFTLNPDGTVDRDSIQPHGYGWEKMDSSSSPFALEVHSEVSVHTEPEPVE